MNQLSSKDFPLFLTIKRMLYMLDASTKYPFFSRDSSGRQVGLEANVEWSNEQGGVFMINQYHKNQTNYDHFIKQLGQKIIDLNADFDGHDSEEKENDKETEATQEQEEK